MTRSRRIGLSILTIALIILTINLPARLNAAFPAGKQILLVEDPGCETWASSSLAKLGITAYTTVSPAQFATVDLNLFDVLYVGNLVLDIAACQNLLTALMARSADIATWAQSTLISCQDASAHFAQGIGGSSAAGTLLANMLTSAAGSGHAIVAEVESFISIAPFGQTPYAWLPTPIVSHSQVDGASGNATHIVTPSPATQGLTDVNLSNWSLSFHCQYASGQYETLVQGTSTAFGTLPIIISTGAIQAQILGLVGRFCIVSGESSACPQNLQPIVGSPGGSLNVSINILGSTSFNSFNVSIKWDPTIANATAVDTTGTILSTPTVLANCLNGGGLGCGPLDGSGVAHVAMSGANTTSPASGRLFKILFRFGVSGGEVRIGYQTGCSISSVPNTSACAVIGTGPIANPGIIPLAEDIQSQLLGQQLPTPFAPTGGITGNFTLGAAPNFADTYLTPYTISLPGSITTWKAQFLGGILSGGVAVPASVQIKVFRKTNATTLVAVAAGPVHDPRQVLQQRIPGYPSFTTESSVMEFYADPLIPVLPGDQIGLTITANSTIGHYAYPYVNRTDTRIFAGNVPVGGAIDLSACLPNPFPPPACLPLPRLPFTPAIQVFIRVRPPGLDTAGDGISDFVKLGPEMQALGADPCRKTVAVQLDYMVPPSPKAINGVISSFDQAPVNATLPCPYNGFPKKPTGVKLIIDVRNQVPFQSVLNFTHSAPLSFDSVKAAFFDPNRVRYFHYGLFAHALAPLGTIQSTISGAGEVFGSNFMVTLGEWPGGGTDKEQEGTIMHEIGHNLGLDHGGIDRLNFKSNYLSVMNYAFQVAGITTVTSGGQNVTRFDYSSQQLPSLNESALRETVGLSNSNDITRWVCPDGRHVKFGVVSGPMDWDCNGQPENVPVTVDINNDTSLGTLTGYNDWANLRYKFTQSASFGKGCTTECDIGCTTECDIGTEIKYADAAVIESQWTAFLASIHDRTSAKVSCTPAAVSTNTQTLCTATITDTNVTTPMTPTGTVSFSSTKAGSFMPIDTCALAGTGASARCAVRYTPADTSLSILTISIAYVGDTSHLASGNSTTVTRLPPLIISKFFTDPSLNPLPTDKNGNPKIDVVLANGIVKSTNPGEIIAWVNVTNTVGPIQSLKLNETLPVDWIVAPTWDPSKGAIHVYSATGTSLATNPEITIPTMISVSTGNPETVSLSIPNFNQTGIGHPLLSGQSLLLAIKLDYHLDMTSQSASSYPRNYTDTAMAAVWSLPSYTGTLNGVGTAFGFFVAYAKVVGDVNGDGKVNILDLSMVGSSFGSKQGDARFNPAADLNNDGRIDILDLSIVGSHFGS